MPVLDSVVEEKTEMRRKAERALHLIKRCVALCGNGSADEKAARLFLHGMHTFVCGIHDEEFEEIAAHPLKGYMLPEDISGILRAYIRSHVTKQEALAELEFLRTTYAAEFDAMGLRPGRVNGKIFAHGRAGAS